MSHWSGVCGFPMSPRRALLALSALLCTALAVLPAQAEGPTRKGEYQPSVGQAGKDVVWVPTPDEVVEKMLDLAQVKAGDRVVDLGSGDGKIAIAAARRGARARGIEYNPDMVALSRRNAREAGVKVDFQQGDIFKSDFRNADVVTLYLLPTLNEKLRPILLDMAPGTRVTSHQFLMGDWEPDETVRLANRDAHLWIVPAKLQGRWELRLNGDDTPTMELLLDQRYQTLSGQARWDGRTHTLSDARVNGRDVRFTLTDEAGVAHRFEGRIDANARFAGRMVSAADGRTQNVFALRR
jgi:SAM-dependent methyltransferase